MYSYVAITTVADECILSRVCSPMVTNMTVQFCINVFQEFKIPRHILAVVTQFMLKSEIQ